MYTAIWRVECTVCSAEPVVGLENELGELQSTGLCGACFFQDRSMLDPETWNEPKESTE